MKRSTSWKQLCVRLLAFRNPRRVTPKFRLWCPLLGYILILHNAEHHRKGIQQDSMNLLWQSSIMVGLLLLTQSQWPTGWHRKWEEHACTNSLCSVSAWTKWSFLLLLKTLFVNFFLNQYHFEETMILSA